MQIGIPRALLYSHNHVFAETFFAQFGVKTLASPATNKPIFELGLRACVDEACLPVKVFIGHVIWLARYCDAILIPRLLDKKCARKACPMICGIKEVTAACVSALPMLIDEPVLCSDIKRLNVWAEKTSQLLGKKHMRQALEKAVHAQNAHKAGTSQYGYPYKVALIGHPYNIGDAYINMNLIKKLNAQGIGIITADCVPQTHIEAEVNKLFKLPFWHYARQYYGSAVHLCKSKSVDGIIYLSAFCCGVDSVVIELIRSAVEPFAFMVLKIDEHTGEAGFDTRIEAYADMLKRRKIGHHIPASGKYISRC